MVTTTLHQPDQIPVGSDFLEVYGGCRDLNLLDGELSRPRQDEAVEGDGGQAVPEHAVAIAASEVGEQVAASTLGSGTLVRMNKIIPNCNTSHGLRYMGLIIIIKVLCVDLISAVD